MNKLDEQLSEAFRAAGPPADELVGDLGQVRRRVHRRRARRRAAGGAAVVLALAGTLILVQESDDGRVVVDDPPSTSGPSSSGASSTSTPPATATATSTTTESSTTSSSGPSSTTTSTVPPSLTRGQLESATYPAPCPSYDTRAVTLTDGQATVSLGPGAQLLVRIADVAFGDGDADGRSDAAVLIQCSFAGADADTGAWAGVYEAGADGRPQPVGTPLVVEHIQSLSMEDDYRAILGVDKYDADDPLCCPSSQVTQVWQFEGSGFGLVSETPR